jgi:ABC-type multidrug transport system fused ATPase/permease subunit
LKTTSQLYFKVASAVLIALFIFIAVNMFGAKTGQLLLIIIISSRIWPRVASIQNSLEQLSTNLPAFTAVKEFQIACQQAKEYRLEEKLNCKLVPIKGKIECKNVVFSYDRNNLNSYALDNINIEIPLNQMTAIVGHSGAGKSTLVDLLIGLNRPVQGEIFIDGVLLTSENLLSLRRHVSYVPQEPFLFNTSIKENLQLVLPDSSEEQMWEALDFAAAADFVKKLPGGLNTIIGDRGVRLSGGERQRLVLARALLRKPSILVLDEATSALDTDNEEKIQEAVSKLKGKMTIIVIAHRLSTIRNADQVVVLDHGKIIQIGKFNQLAREKRSIFSKLLDKQLELIRNEH